MTDLEQDLLTRLAMNEDIKSSDRPSDRARTRLKNWGYIAMKAEPMSNDDAPHFVEKRVSQYIQLRDKLKELDEMHEKSREPFVELMNKVQGELMAFLDQAGANSVKTSLGTAIVNTRWTASLADPQAFMDFVIANNRFDLMDRRANAPAVKEYVQSNPAGISPPGVNLSAIRTLGVRRPTAKAE